MGKVSLSFPYLRRNLCKNRNLIGRCTMKKTLLILILILSFVATSLAFVKTPTTTSLTTSTWAAVTAQEACPYGFSVWTNDGTAFKYSVNSDGTGSVTVPNGTISFPDAIESGEIVFYAQASLGTPSLVFQASRRSTRY